MVKFLASIFLLLATLPSLIFASPFQPDASINKFIGDLHNLSGGISRLASGINSIGNTLTVPEALALRNSVEQVEADFDKANSEVKGIRHVSFTDAKNVLDITEGFAPVLVETLKRFGEKKDVLAKSPFVSISQVQKVLVTLHDSAAELTTAIVDLEPSSLKREAERIKSELNTAFDKAIKIYS